MESPGSDDEMLRQEKEATFSKKMKILIIMLSLVLMVLLLPLASNHGVPLLRPMGASMLQRLWDAMRFIAMTAAISVGIISTSSNSHRNSKGSNGSSHHGSSSSSFHSRSSAIASSSREGFNPNMANSTSMNRSGPFRRQSEDIVADSDDIDDYQWRGHTQMVEAHNSKGKKVMNDMSSSDRGYMEPQFDGSRVDNYREVAAPQSKQSEKEPIEAEEHVNLRLRPVKLSMVNPSRRHMSAGSEWFQTSRIDEEVEEEPMAANAGYELSFSGGSRGETNILNKVDNAKKKSLVANHGKEVSKKDVRSADKGLTNVYNRMTDDNYAELKMRKSAISHLAEEYAEENGKGRRRSSSVDRRRPIYIYDQLSPDQPGLKQILMEISRERASKSKMSDSNTSSNQAYNGNQRVLERPTRTRLYVRSDSSTAVSSASVEPSLKPNVQHQQASTISTVRMPSHVGTMVKHVDGRDTGTLQKQSEAAKVDHKQISQWKQVDADKMGPSQMDQKRQQNVIKFDSISQGPTSSQVWQKQPNPKLGYEQHVDIDHAKVSSRQNTRKQVDGAMVDLQPNVRRGGVSKSQMGSNRALQKQDDVTMRSTHRHRPYAKDSDHILLRQSSDKLGSEGEGTSTQCDSQSKATLSSTSKRFKQSSKHSRSALNLEQLEQAVSESTHQQSKPPVGPSARGRRSISYDFGDGFTPDWLMELEPPAPPGLFSEQSSTTTGSEQFDKSNSEAKGANSTSFLMESLVPWRVSAPIDIASYPPRGASPTLSQASGPSPGEVNRKADEFISNFTTRLMKQKQESLERQMKYLNRGR